MPSLSDVLVVGITGHATALTGAIAVARERQRFPFADGRTADALIARSTFVQKHRAMVLVR